MAYQHAAPLPVSRRRLLALMLSATGASLLAACSPAANPSGAANSSAAPQSAGQATTAPAVVGTAPAGAGANAPTPAAAAAQGGDTPKRGGSLRWGQVGDIVTTDAVLSSPASNETTGEVCDELIAYSDDLKPQPRLAESWDAQHGSDHGQAQLAQRRDLPLWSGVHQRRRRIQHPACAGSKEPVRVGGRTRERVVDQHPETRQEHYHPDVRQAASRRLGLDDLSAHSGQGRRRRA